MWYLKPTAGHETHGQSAVIEEGTGRDVALVYDGKRDGLVLAAAPAMLAALRGLLELVNFNFEPTDDGDIRHEAEYRAAAAAIALAEGGE